jgi:ribosomal protein S27AE
MSAVDPKAEAIALLKEGRPAGEVHAQLVARGVAPDAAGTLVNELLALKQQADAATAQAAARDPKRLRQEAKWMFVRGATLADVVAYFASLGVDEVYARPEAERLQAIARSMRPCPRCGGPTEPSEMTMDLGGNTICKSCSLRDDIRHSEARGVASTLESLGMTPLLVDAVESLSMDAATARPVCQACHLASGVHISAYDAEVRIRYSVATRWICGQCGRPIG